MSTLAATTLLLALARLACEQARWQFKRQIRANPGRSAIAVAAVPGRRRTEPQLQPQQQPRAAGRAPAMWVAAQEQQEQQHPGQQVGSPHSQHPPTLSMAA